MMLQHIQHVLGHSLPAGSQNRSRYDDAATCIFVILPDVVLRDLLCLACICYSLAHHLSSTAAVGTGTPYVHVHKCAAGSLSAVTVVPALTAPAAHRAAPAKELCFKLNRQAGGTGSRLEGPCTAPQARKHGM